MNSNSTAQKFDCIDPVTIIISNVYQEHPLCPCPCSKHCVYNNLFTLHNILGSKFYYYHQLANEAWKGLVAMVKMHHCHGQMVQLVGASTLYQKVMGSGHIPRLWVRTPVWEHLGGKWLMIPSHMDVSLSLPLSFPLSLSLFPFLPL